MKWKWVENYFLVRFEKCTFRYTSRFICKKWDTKIEFISKAPSRVQVGSSHKGGYLTDWLIATKIVTWHHKKIKSVDPKVFSLREVQNQD